MRTSALHDSGSVEFKRDTGRELYEKIVPHV
jgi:hypothetical protein